MKIIDNHIPIVFIHRGDSLFLLLSLAQAKYSNPLSKLYLIGDHTNNCYNFVEHHMFSWYFRSAKEFENIYRHFSINNYSYELFCFQRWFVLYSFMVSNNLEKCVYIDSDVMLYANLSNEQKRFSNLKFTLLSVEDTSRKICNPNLIFINDMDALKSFCDFVSQNYTDPSLLKDIANCYMGHDERQENISDMHLFWKYKKIKDDVIGTTNIVIEGSTFDMNINCSEGYEVMNGIKKITWIDNYPYCQQLNSNKLIRMNSLHFQGRSKKLMKLYYTGKEHSLFFCSLQRKNHKLLLRLRKLLKKNFFLSKKRFI